MRLDRYLAEAGKGTRAQVKKIIMSGKVTVNENIVKDPAAKINEKIDTVVIDNEIVEYAETEYYMLNKPKDVISATKSNGGLEQVCVTDLITGKKRKDLFPVGRLDKDTEGLLIITNDGKLAHRLLSPKKHVDKTYYVELSGRLDTETTEKIMHGVDIGDEKPTLSCDISRLSDTSCFVTICEGRYHQIKRMFAVCGLEVTELKRISMGPIALDPELAPGEYRELTQEEIEHLRSFDS